MSETFDELDGLIEKPRESRDVELKRWIDPSMVEGRAKIAKACLALRNNDGGRLLIGFTNNGEPDSANAPPNVDESFHVDVIQAIVSKFAFPGFDVDVEVRKREDTQICVVITVPSGIETPVAAKSTLTDTDGKVLVEDHAIYVRSINSNNTVSSTKARRGDWERLVKICFDNREADIGAFFRRHLSGIDLGKVLESVDLRQLLFFPNSAGTRKKDAVERASEELHSAHSRFESAAQQRAADLPAVGTREVAFVIDGEVPPHELGREFLRRLQVDMPQHSGWTPWVDLSNAPDESMRPYINDGAWEAFLYDPVVTIAGTTLLDFWRINPAGEFYHLRGYEDDLSEGHGGPKPFQYLDFLLQISRVAEIISVSLSFARSMGCDESETSLAFAFRWTKLRNRRFASWVEKRRFLRFNPKAVQDDFETTITVPLETPRSAIPSYVGLVVNPLFALFEGMKVESKVIEEIAEETLGRRC